MNKTLSWVLTGIAFGMVLYVLMGCASNGNGLIPHKTTIYGGEIIVYDHGNKTVVPVTPNNR